MINVSNPNRLIFVNRTLTRLAEGKQTSMEVILVFSEACSSFTRFSETLENQFQDLEIRKIFQSKNTGLSDGRNAGVRAAKGTIIAFIDDDALPSEDWVTNLRRCFIESNADCVMGKVTPSWIGSHQPVPSLLWWVVSCTDSSFPSTRQSISRGYGANMSFNKSVFPLIGFFDKRVGNIGGMWRGGEETEFLHRLANAKMKIVYDPTVVVYHLIPADRTSRASIIRRAFGQGVSLYRYSSLVSSHQSISYTSDYLIFVVRRIGCRIIHPGKVISIDDFMEFVLLVGANTAVAAGYLFSFLYEENP